MDAHHHGAMPGLAAPELAHHDVVDLPPLGTAAARTVVTPTSEKAPDAANVEGPGQSETQSLIFEQHADDGKCFATLLELKSYSLSRSGGDDGPVCFYVTRWGMARELPCLRAVGDMLRRIGGQQ